MSGLCSSSGNLFAGPAPPVWPVGPQLYWFLREQNGIAEILTFMHVATSKLSPLVFFEALGA